MEPAARLLRAALLAGACALVFATHVYVDYSGIRTRLVTNPVAATGGAVRIDVAPANLKEIRSPFAVIARIRNEAGAADRFVIQIDDTPVCEPSVAAASTHRVDCVLNREWSSRVPHVVTIRSAANQWTLEYLELSTHHGSSSGLLRVIVLPVIATRYVLPAPVWVVILWLVLTRILLLPAFALPNWLSVLHKTILGLFVLWTSVCLLSPWVSNYRVLADLNSFVVWLILLVAPQLYAVGRGPATVLATSSAPWAFVAQCALVAALVLACFGAVLHRRLHEEFHGNYSGFLRLSRARIDANPMLEGRDDVKRSLAAEDSPGYDAQFMYAMTFDPFLRRYRDHPATYLLFIDGPPYRYGRIGFSVLTKIFSGDRWNLYPATMIALILVSLALCAFMIAVAARAGGGSALWGALVILTPGFWTSLNAGLPEPVAAAALLSGYLCVRSRHWVAAGLLFAVSILVRETGALLVVCLAVSMIASRQWRVALGLLAMSIVPLILWRLFVGWVFFPAFGAQAFPKPPDDFGAPFAGMIDLWTALARGQYWPDNWGMRRASFCYSLLVAGAFVLSSVLAVRKPSPITIAAAGFGALAVFFNLKNVWVHSGNAERLSSDLLLMLALVSAVSFRDYSRSLRASVVIFWAAAAGYMCFAILDAPFIRGTLLPTFLSGVAR